MSLVNRQNLASPTLPVFWGRVNLIAGIVLIVIIFWAAIAKVDVSIKAGGRTLSSGENKKIQHLEGGIVSEILTTEGQNVKAGQALFRIRNESNTATLRENELKLQSLKLSLQRLNAEVNDTPLSFSEKMVIDNPDMVRHEQNQYNSRKMQREEELQVLKQQVEQKKNTLIEQRGRVNNLQQELKTATKQLAIVQKLVESGAASTNRMLDIEGKVGNFRTQINATISSIPVTQSELNEASGRLKEITARQKNDLLDELRKNDLEVQQLTERLKADRDRVDRTAVLSPVNGIINRLYVHTIGGTVHPGEILAEITPANEKIIVEAKIPPENRGKVWVGQPAKVKVTAFEYTTYGMIDGEIIDISADSFSDEQGKPAYYRVKIALKKSVIGDGHQIMTGMMTEVNIISGKRTVLDYLIRPIIRIKEDAFKER